MTGGGAGRVIAGTARGIRLTAPGPGTRPVGDRVKQTLFAILEPRLRGARVLDLFAGSGAMGIEALSRGAASAVFVERDAGALASIRDNLRRTHLDDGRARIDGAEAARWLARTGATGERFDLVVVDPPYGRPVLGVCLERLGAGGHLAPGAVVVVKHGSRDTPPARAGLLASRRERRFGETVLTFYEVAPPTDGGGEEDR